MFSKVNTKYNNRSKIVNNKQLWRVNIMDIISNITSLADNKGISQAFICDKLGKKRNYLFNLKKQNKEPSEDQMAIIANVLGTTIAYLKGETDDPEKQQQKSPSEVDELVEALKDADIYNMVKALLKKNMSKEELEEAIAYVNFKKSLSSES